MPDDTNVNPVEPAATEEAPKPRRRRRTKAEIEADKAAKEAAAAAAAESGEAPKPRRRRRTKAEIEADKAAAAAAAGEPANKPEVKADAVPAPAPEATSAAEGESAPAKPRRRRRTKAEVVAEGDAPVQPQLSIEEMTRLTQEATQASSEPQPMPSATLSGDQASATATPAPAAGEQQAEGQGTSRRRRRNKNGNGNGNGNADQPKANNNGNGNGNNNGNGKRQNGQSRRNRNRKGGQGQEAAQPSLTLEALNELRVADLRTKAAELGVDYVGVRKGELVEAIYAAAARAEGFRPVNGILEIGPEGYGWLRTGNYMKGEDDCFVHTQIIRQFGLRVGDRVEGTVGPGRNSSKYPPLQSVSRVNGADPESMRNRPRFRDLTPIYPNESLVMECGKSSITGRAIDLVAPIGKGQRGLIVSPPKAGKTTVLKKICQSIAANNPEVHLFCLLVDERPEEVTDMERSIRGEVVASTFDMPADNHTAVSELVIEHAKRLVEMGEDVVVVLDSITRLARAYNLAQPASGRILSGGVDSAALYPPKKFLGAARNIENGGSLTIIASALVDTGSKMDEVIFEEFKGTGNMELKLDRDLADKRIFPAIDPVASGTRNEDLLVDPELQPFVWGIRRVLANMNNTERAAQALVKGLKATDSNLDFLRRSAKKASQMDYMGV